MTPEDPVRPFPAVAGLEIQEQIGSGAFGTVFRARDPLIERRVALKVLRPEVRRTGGERAQQRLLREIRALGALQHPHVATLYRVHALEGEGVALEMEYVDGETYEARLAGGRRLPVAEVRDLARALGAALRCAHEVGIVHGDVKPANVMRARDGTLKLVDFGLARLRDAEGGAPGGSGTPHYLAPEVVEGSARGSAADVWSLGALLYRALAGRLPFDAGSLHGLYHLVLNAEPPPLPPEVPASLRDLVFACLAKRPDDRPVLDDAFVRAVGRDGAADDASGPALRLPARHRLVGREQEWTLLLDALERTRAGAGQAVVLLGAAGLGKSRLVSALTGAARARGFGVVEGTVTAGEGLLRPLDRALRREVEGGSGGGESPARAAAPAGSGTAVDRPAPSVAFAEVERGLRGLAEVYGVLLVLEDLHAALPDDLRLLARLWARLADARVMLVVTERLPDGEPEAGRELRAASLLGGGAQRLDLGPLGREALARMLHESAGGAPPADLVEQAASRAGGNPLFALHLLSHAVEMRARRGDGADASDAPPLLRSLMARRLDGLPEDLREVLDAASVDGLRFEAGTIAAALRLDPLEVLRRLQRLAHRPGLLEPLPRGYRFAHPLLQETVYAEVAPDLRRALHGELARGLAARTDDVDPERLGSHWERSDEPERRVGPLLEAAYRAAARIENWRCVDLGLRAGVSPGAVPVPVVRAHAAALFEVASALHEIGRSRESEALYEDLERAAREGGDEVLLDRIVARRAHLRLLGPGLTPADVEALERAAARLPSCLERGIAAFALAVRARHRGELEAATEWLRLGDEEFVKRGATGRHGSVLDQQASIARSRGDRSAATAAYREASRVSLDAGRTSNAAISEVNALLIDLEQGQADGAAERLRGAIRAVEADGGFGPASRIRAVLADVLLASGDLSLARGEIERAVAAAERARMAVAVAEGRATAAEIECAGGDVAAARAHLLAARESAQRMGMGDLGVRLAALEALCAWLDGDAARADGLAEVARTESRRVHGDEAVGEDLAPLLDAMVLGLDGGLLARLGPPRTKGGDAETAATRSVRLHLEGLRAFAAADAAVLEDVARRMHDPSAGGWRVAQRLVADGWRAIAARLRGNDLEAHRVLDDPRDGARRAGLAPLAAWLERLGARLDVTTPRIP